MHARIVWGKIRKGRWADYRNHFVDRVGPATEHVKGLRSRHLLRGIEDPDEGISISLWDSLEDMDNYDKSELRQSISKEAQHLYAGEYSIEHFDVEYTFERERTE